MQNSKAKIDYDISENLPLFNVEEVIAKGSFSQVFKATHKSTKKLVAIKYFQCQVNWAKKCHKTAREIAFMKILHHPNIITLNSFEINSRYAYITTKYATLGHLGPYCYEQKRNVPEKTIQKIMKQLISALLYMHNLDILHGDVKPENILCMSIDQDGPYIKICDFGLSEIKIKDDNLNFNSGTSFYLAPEIVFKYPVDVRCDLWSVGIVMYNLMFKRTIFSYQVREARAFIHQLKQRHSINFEGSEKFSETCNSLVKGLLTYDKEKRIQGKTLIEHPFLTLETPKDVSGKFINDASEHVNLAILQSTEKKYGEALVEAIQATLKLQIFYNRTKDLTLKQHLMKKWKEYETFIQCTEDKLAVHDFLNETNEDCLLDEEFKRFLISTPRLMDGFDIGCKGEMFLKEGKKQKAAELFRESLQVLLPLMKTEPPSSRKDILGRRIKKWIQYMELLNNEVHTSTLVNGSDVCKPSSTLEE